MHTDHSDSRLIYSSDLGSLCPECGKPKGGCVCRQIQRAALPQASGLVRVRFETAYRKGKGMTLIAGLPLSQDALSVLVRQLKQQFGTGGAVKDHVIELQGNHCQKALQALRALGYLVAEK